MASNLLASDVLDWQERIREQARRLLEGAPAETTKAPPVISRVDNTVNWEPVVIPEKNVVTDPNSWLNKGLNNLVDAVGDVVLGQESGSGVVDYGVANVPGVGPAAILAAGGVPGILDLAGVGELKNIAKIPKYTLEFVGKHFGEKGLRNLDNALTKVPKAGKPSVNDAIYIMRAGIGGEQVPAIVPYTSGNVLGDIAKYAKVPEEELPYLIKKGHDEIASIDAIGAKERADQAVRGLYDAVNRGDYYMGNYYLSMLSGAALNEVMPGGTAKAFEMLSPEAVRKVRNNRNNMGEFYQYAKDRGASPEEIERLRIMKELNDSPLQDWDRLVEQQERREAQQLAKAEKKAAKQANVKSEPVQKRTEEIMEAALEAPKPEEVVPEAPKETPKSSPSEILGGPTKWRENGWKSSQYSPNFYEKFGRNMDEESKRDLFVVDSLANHWASQLGKNLKNGDFSRTAILTPWERAVARHSLTNYPQVSRSFTEDILANIKSGNMPGKSVKFGPRYKNNVLQEGQVTPTLILDIGEKPRVIDNTRIWADEAEGPDLYEMIFRPKVDRKLNALNPQYWEY